MSRRYLGGLVGALALLGLGATPAFAVQANNDGPIFTSVPGSTLSIRISLLLSNDTPGLTARSFVKAFRTTQSSGIKSLSVNKKTGLIKVVLRNNFVGQTLFRYQITSLTKPKGTSVASVFIVVSPN